MKIISWNVAAPVAPPIRYSSQKERMRRIPKEIARYNPDVLLVQESMSYSQHKLLVDGLREIGLGFSTDHITGQTIMPGGVVIFSGFPIFNEHREAFTDSIGTDALSAKGFVYAYTNGVHVIGFHLQAWPTAESAAVRVAQTRQMRAFIDTLPRSEPLLVAGDLNVDYYSQRRHFRELTGILGLQYAHLREDSHEYTFDPATNALTGNDDDTFYASSRYPRGCYNEYISTMRCPCCPRELLDFVFYRGIPDFEARVLPMKTEVFEADVNINTKRHIMDLSDHYAVLAEVPLRGNARAPPAEIQTRACALPAVYPVFAIIILAALVYVAVSLGRGSRAEHGLPVAAELDASFGGLQKVLGSEAD